MMRLKTIQTTYKSVVVLIAVLITLILPSKLLAQNYPVKWYSVGGGLNTNGVIYAMTTFNGDLYVAGSFSSAGGVTASNIAKWNGTTWSSLGSGFNKIVTGLTVFNNELYAVGVFDSSGSTPVSYVAKWNGSAWVAFGSGLNSGVSKIIGYNNQLYIAGGFNSSNGSVPNYVAKWSGTGWVALGTGISQTGTGGQATSLAIFNNELYIGGYFTVAGGVTVNHIARWDGTIWKSAGTGVTGTGATVTCMEAFNSYLYVGGDFTSAGPSATSYIAKWSGTSWSTTSLNLPAKPGSLCVYKSYLYVTGGTSGTTIYRGNGSGSWQGATNGVNGSINSMTVHNSSLILGGPFNQLYPNPPYSNFYGLVNMVVLPDEPTIQSDSIWFNNRTENSMSVHWKRGNGNKCLVAARSYTPINKVPIDTQTYLANDSFYMGSNLGNNTYVVYNGTGNSVTVKNLKSDSMYQFAVFEYNDDNLAGMENYFTNAFQYPTSYRLTMATEPTQSTMGITFSNITLTSMKVNITQGNGFGRLIVAKQGSSVNQTPVDTVISYSPNNTFGSGTDLGGGNYVVDGGSTSFTLTGLTANTMYYFASYEYNGQAYARNYKTTSPYLANQSSLTIEPTNQPSNIQFTNVKDSSMTLSWTGGNGQRRFVVAGTTVLTTNPVDGINYLTNDTFGLGADLGLNHYVVYSGTANTFNLKGLTPNTTYYYTIYEYNGTNTSNNYLLPNPATASKSTLIGEPTSAASNLTLTPITNGITTVNWTNGNGDSRIVIARQGVPISILPVDGNGYNANAVFGSGDDLGQGNFVCYVGNSNSFDLQGLDPSKVYYVAVIEYNGSGVGANYKLNSFPIVNNLPAQPTTLASNLNFSNLTSSSVKVSWANGNGSFRMLIIKEGAAVSKSPIDGNVYVANPVFGTGDDLGLANFIVYNGVGNNVTVTGLNSGSIYHFSLFEFNKDASGPPNYMDAGLTGSVNLFPQSAPNLTNSVSVSVYPNPSNGLFNLNNSGDKKIIIILTDLTGRELAKMALMPKQNIQSDFSTLRSGSYILSFCDGVNTRYERITLIR
ncbi:MAG: T9SS type A sorting domain-containing protein [Bacteroidia bacterium]|nr:T9SS type A sorting domain-containing protein [Bacteroidia bacterium]